MYLIHANSVFATNSSGRREGWIEVNNGGTPGSTRKYGYDYLASTVQTAQFPVRSTLIYHFTTGDTIQIVVFTSSGTIDLEGGTNSIYSEVQIVCLSE